MFARDSTLWHRAFFHIKNRLAGSSVETENESCFGALQYRRNDFSIVPQVNEGGLGGQIVIPDIVVNELLIPGNGSGFGIQRDERVCVEVVALPFATVEIRACGTGRYIDQAQFGIRCERRPGISGPVYSRLIRVPAGIGRITVVAWYRVSAP